MKTFPGTVSALEELVQQGLLLHGSPGHVKARLHPGMGSCLTGMASNCRKGVYATDSVAVAYFCALTPRLRPGQRLLSAWMIGADGQLRFYMSSVLLRELKPGVIYLLRRNGFETAGGAQYICRTSVVPIGYCRVEPNAFPHRILPV